MQYYIDGTPAQLSHVQTVQHRDVVVTVEYLVLVDGTNDDVIMRWTAEGHFKLCNLADWEPCMQRWVDTLVIPSRASSRKHNGEALKREHEALNG